MDLPQFHRALRSFLDSKSDNTVDAYQRDLMDFCDFVKIPRARRFDETAATKAIAHLFTKPVGEAHHLAIGYQNQLIKVGRAPKTVDRRISTLRSLNKICRTLGLCHFNLEVSNIGDDVVRDTKGPEEDGVKRMLKVLSQRYTRGNHQEKRKALRDRAILRLMYDRAFRRGDVVQLNIGSIDFTKRIAWLKRKKRRQLEPYTLAKGTLAVVNAWLKVRGEKDPAAPMFVGITKNGQHANRIDQKTVYLVIRGLGKEAGLKTWPHALRHAAATEALNKTNGDIRAVAKFLGHKNPTTTMIYDDNRRDMGGKVTDQLAEDVER